MEKTFLQVRTDARDKGQGGYQAADFGAVLRSRCFDGC